MFAEMLSILERTTMVTMTISKEGDQLRVNFIPKAKNEEYASVTPLSLIGTAEELDREITQVLTRYSAKSESIAEQMDRYEKEAEAARADAAKKAEEAQKKRETKASTPARTATPAKAKPEPAEESFDDLFGDD